MILSQYNQIINIHTFEKLVMYNEFVKLKKQFSILFYKHVALVN